MRTTSMKTMLAMGAVCLMGSVLQAQEHMVNARVPFNFEIESKVYPAGEYRIVNDFTKANAEILNRRTGERRFLRVNLGPIAPTGKNCLVFHRYGDNYFLSEIQMADSQGRKLPVSKHEKELVLAPRNSDVTVAANRRAD